MNQITIRSAKSLYSLLSLYNEILGLIDTNDPLVLETMHGIEELFKKGFKVSTTNVHIGGAARTSDAIVGLRCPFSDRLLDNVTTLRARYPNRVGENEFIERHSKASKKVSHEYHEGPEATKRFKSALKTVLSVPREEIERREKQYQAEQATKPKRGPKPKTSVSRAHGSDD